MTSAIAWTKHLTLKRYRGIKLQLIRKMCDTNHQRIVEFKIPVPWGHIAGKLNSFMLHTSSLCSDIISLNIFLNYYSSIFIYLGKEWGDANGEPWIALHGWLDNCGSFDRLLPHFPKNQRVICLDIPGHGFSTHYPPGNS